MAAAPGSRTLTPSPARIADRSATDPTTTSRRETVVTEPVVHRRPRRRRGGWVTWVAIVLIIGAIAVVGDRLAAKAASSELQSRIQSELVSRNVAYSSLQAEVGGMPFLTQVAQGRYESITIDMTDVRLPDEQGRGATLPALNLAAIGMKVNTGDLRGGTVRLGGDTVTATLGSVS